MKKLDAQNAVQRYSPRRSAKSELSELNKERVRRMIAAGQMTPSGLVKIQTRMDETFAPSAEILAALRRNPDAWKHFQDFPDWYQRIRLGSLEATRQRGHPDIYQKRLAYFLKMTALNKRYGQMT